MGGPCPGGVGPCCWPVCDVGAVGPLVATLPELLGGGCDGGGVDCTLDGGGWF